METPLEVPSDSRSNIAIDDPEEIVEIAHDISQNAQVFAPTDVHRQGLLYQVESIKRGQLDMIEWTDHLEKKIRGLPAGYELYKNDFVSVTSSLDKSSSVNY